MGQEEVIAFLQKYAGTKFTSKEIISRQLGGSAILKKIRKWDQVSYALYKIKPHNKQLYKYWINKKEEIK